VLVVAGLAAARVDLSRIIRFGRLRHEFGKDVTGTSASSSGRPAHVIFVDATNDKGVMETWARGMSPNYLGRGGWADVGEAGRQDHRHRAALKMKRAVCSSARCSTEDDAATGQPR